MKHKEEIVVDKETGGRKGDKLAHLGDLDPMALWTVAEVAGFGGLKYDQYNYAKGYKWSLSYNALQRHLMLFWGGEDLDAESGLPHIAHACWHTLALLCFAQRGRGTDDRFPSEVKKPEGFIPLPEKMKPIKTTCCGDPDDCAQCGKRNGRG